MNPTAALADIVLPKTTTLEEEEVSLNGHAPCVTWTAAVAARQGECTRWEIAWDLVRMAARSAHRREVHAVAHAARVQRIPVRDTDLDPRRWPHAATRFEHRLGDFAAQGVRRQAAGAPATLQTGLREKTTTTRALSRPGALGRPIRWSLHPDTARELGIAEGDW
jgi:anaerobic selenocysteine-containing dehydrogenase